MRKCFLITAYCETEEKEKSLKDTVSKIHGKYDILLISHYPVDIEIQKLCNYVIYDYSNPVLSYKEGRRAIISWRKLNHYKLNCLTNDYGFAALQQIKRGLLFLLSIGYDIGIVINYDTKILEGFLEEMEEHLDEFDGIFLNFGVNSEPSHYLAFFLIKIGMYKDNLQKISLDKYLGSDDLMAEGYFANLIPNNIKVLKRDEWRNKVWTDVVYTKDFFQRGNSKTNLFLGLEKWCFKDEIKEFDRLSFLCYNILDDFELKFIYNNELIYFSKINTNNGHFYSHLPIKFSEFKSEDFTVLIDEVEVYSEYKNSILYSSIEKLDYENTDFRT